ncbi:hypothetical protein C8R43DRAFT_1156320 [Mycena crocata]|nr:hypothetical protein C8R43DRAFT_1156320 [Mycena crocata]
MQGDNIRISRWKTKKLYHVMRTDTFTYRVWWNRERSPYEPLDPDEFPEGRVFGQIIGEYQGVSSRYWELGTPWFEKRTTGAERITDSFAKQLEIMGEIVNGSDKVKEIVEDDAKIAKTFQQLMLAGISREDHLCGTVLKLSGIEYPLSNLVGRVVIIPVRFVEGDTAETNKMVSDGIVVII